MENKQSNQESNHDRSQPISGDGVFWSTEDIANLPMVRRACQGLFDDLVEYGIIPFDTNAKTDEQDEQEKI